MKKTNTNLTYTVLLYTSTALVITAAVLLAMGIWGGLWLFVAAVLIHPTIRSEEVDEETAKKIIDQYEKDKKDHNQTKLDLK